MTVHIFGGGSIMYVRGHMALCAPARGRTARQLAQLLREEDVSVRLHLTSMADPDSDMETNDDVERRLRKVLALESTRGVIFNVALCDFEGQIGDVPSGKYAQRLQTRQVTEDGLPLVLRPTKKLLGLVRELRPDVKTIGFKTTTNDNMPEQVARANRMAGEHGIHWMLANDTGTRVNIVLRGGGAAELPEALYTGMDRQVALQTLAAAYIEELRHG